VNSKKLISAGSLKSDKRKSQFRKKRYKLPNYPTTSGTISKYKQIIAFIAHFLPPSISIYCGCQQKKQKIARKSFFYQNYT